MNKLEEDTEIHQIEEAQKHLQPDSAPFKKHNEAPNEPHSPGDAVAGHMKGWSLFILSFMCAIVPVELQLAILKLRRLGVAIFLVTMEVSIVATSLVSIANELNRFNMTSWIVTAYLITYTGLYHFLRSALN